MMPSHPPILFKQKNNNFLCKHYKCTIPISHYDHQFCYKHAQSEKEIYYHKQNKQILNAAKYYIWGKKYL